MDTTDGDRPATSSGARRRWTLAAFGYVAPEGAGLQMRGAVVPVLRETFGVPAWQLGLVTAAAGIAGVPVVMGFVVDTSGIVPAMRLLVVPPVAMVLVLAALSAQGAGTRAGP